MRGNTALIACIVFLVLFNIVTGFVCSAFIMTVRVVTRSLINVNSLLIFGSSIGFYIVVVFPLETDPLSASLMTISVFMLLGNTFVGVHASRYTRNSSITFHKESLIFSHCATLINDVYRTRNIFYLRLYTALSTFNFVMCIVSATISYDRVRSSTMAYLNSLTPEELYAGKYTQLIIKIDTFLFNFSFIMSCLSA
jgi:hypothetical protein